MELNRTILITGSSSGIGYQAVLNMLNMGFNIIAPCRNLQRASQTLSRLKNDNVSGINFEKQISLPVLDLSSLKSIDDFASEIRSESRIIDSLVLNAGLQYTGSKDPRWSEDGLELTFAVNHLSNQYLTQKILPCLYQSRSPRVVITSSEVHNPESPGGKIGKLASVGDLKGLSLGKGFKMLDGNLIFNADKAYKDSKLCNILFARELYRRLNEGGKKMPVLTWAPGLIIPRNNEGFFRYSRQYNKWQQIIFATIARDILKITETEVIAGEILSSLSVEPKYNNCCFSYRSNRIVGFGKKSFEESEISKEASNDDLARNLWDKTNFLLKIDSDLF